MHVQRLQLPAEITQVSSYKRVQTSYFKYTVQLFFTVRIFPEIRKRFNSIFDWRPSIKDLIEVCISALNNHCHGISSVKG